MILGVDELKIERVMEFLPRGSGAKSDTNHAVDQDKTNKKPPRDRLYI